MRRRKFVQGGLSTIGLCAAGAAEAQVQPQLFPNFFLCRRPVKVRRNIYELFHEDTNHPIIQNYRKGVEVMKSRPDSDPTSWAYQANIHGTTLSPASWPAGAPFATCEHSTQFFLSWHRMYLHFFERILRKACGNPDFALPYWDWTVNRSLPPPFRDPVIGPDPNPLFDATRSASINNGNPMPASAVQANDDLAEANYFDFQSGAEGTPHGTIHVTIGGNMGNFAGAGRDPIFWLHHCNIDRLWEVWLFSDTNNSNPTTNATWLNQTYTFATETGSLVSIQGSDILDTETQLRYVYEHTCRPLFILTNPIAISPAQRRRRTVFSELLADEVRVRSSGKTVLQRGMDQERLETPLRLMASPDGDTKAVLTFEGIRSERPVDGYLEVYVGLKDESDANFESPHYAGNLDLFGSDSGSRRSMAAHEGKHAEHGLTRELDITELLQRLIGGGRVDMANLSVTLVPAGATADNEAMQINEEAIPTIDSITLSFVKTDG